MVLSPLSLCYDVPNGSILNLVLLNINTIPVSNVVAYYTGVEEHQNSDDLQ